MSSNTLEIIRGLAQAASNAYDGSHDKRYVVDGEDINSPYYIGGTDKVRTPDLRDFCFIIWVSYICLK